MHEHAFAEGFLFTSSCCQNACILPVFVKFFALHPFRLSAQLLPKPEKTWLQGLEVVALRDDLEVLELDGP